MDYQEFLRSKAILHPDCGIDPSRMRFGKLFPFQRDITKWALRKGRAAVFADCGLGKSPMQLTWAKKISGKVLILAPLAVAQQTANTEAPKFDCECVYAREPVSAHITITNYDILHKFNPDDYEAVILDESSILKSFDSKTRNELIEKFRDTPYKLACTATPSPNDYMELGNHSEFLGNLSRTEMLSTFFVHDGGDTSKWRLKGHAEKEFWKWVCSWAVMIRKPSDLGYPDDDFMLPELRIHEIVVDCDKPSDGYLFPIPAQTLGERREARRDSIDLRAMEVLKIIGDGDQVFVWCNLNAESDAVTELAKNAEWSRFKIGGLNLDWDFAEVRGADSREHKERVAEYVAAGRILRTVSKSSIFGYGMNFQKCHRVVFYGLSDSYEEFYQAVRRFWRFGQKHPVDCYIVTSSQEGEVVKNIKRKEVDAQRMAQEMVANMHEINEADVRGQSRQGDEYKTDRVTGDTWDSFLGDNVETIKTWPDNSVHYEIYSPPFASLYTYSASERDMGNCRTHQEFYDHFKFLAPELLRVLKPGRLMSFHCMNLPTSKERDGVIGITDFRGELIKIFKEVGFIYHSEVCIWKDPVTAMQRTKALGLLHKQLKKDSCMSRQGIPDYLVTMRKPGDNPERVTHTDDSFPVHVWQRYASPVWMDINPNDTLQKESAREDDDERHICPLQLEVIQRGIEMWTNPGDLVLDPFSGIASTGYQAVKMGRNFMGIELKESYFRQGVGNLRAAEIQQEGLFSGEVLSEPSS